MECHGIKPGGRLSRLIESWHDGCITPGEEWEPQIKENLQKAQIILLLISVNFISSKYCNTVELTQAIKRHKSGNALVIPLVLKPCMWHPIPVGDMTLGELQALPKDALPVTCWDDQDEAYTNIAQGLYEKILQLQQERAAEAERQRQEAEAALSHQRKQEEAERKRREAERQEAEAAQRRRQEQEAAERQRQEAEAQRQREAAERQRQREDYYNGGIYHLEQGNLDQAIADLTQAKQLGHPDAAQLLSETKSCKQAQAVEKASDLTWLEKLRNYTSSLVTQTEQRLQEADDLSSEKGIDYTRLRDLLKAQDWKAADRETYEVILRAVGKKSGDRFTSNELLNFPCTDLLTIDRLWVKYSQGRFGFSVQKQIYVECGAKLDGKYPGDTIWRKFGDKVGWRVNGSWISNSRVTFSTSAPLGHLPLLWWYWRGARSRVVPGVGGYSLLWSSLLSHRDL